MEKREVAQVFEKVVDLLDIQGENPFRVLAYRNAARTIRDLPTPPAQTPPEKLEDLDGIGKDLAGKIATILESGNGAG
jgi:DNA polymerase (family 10)